VAERSKCYVHTEGDENDVLFQLPLLSRRLAEGETLSVTLNGAVEVTYKVETVKYKLVEASVQNPSEQVIFWASDEVYYGVSIDN